MKKSAPDIIGANEYRCEACQQVYSKGWSDGEADAEFDEVFPDFVDCPKSIVCDDCYRAMTGDLG